MPVLPLSLKKERGVRDSGRGELAVSVPTTITLISHIYLWHIIIFKTKCFAYSQRIFKP